MQCSQGGDKVCPRPAAPPPSLLAHLLPTPLPRIHCHPPPTQPSPHTSAPKIYDQHHIPPHVAHPSHPGTLTGNDTAIPQFSPYLAASATSARLSPRTLAHHDFQTHFFPFEYTILTIPTLLYRGATRRPQTAAAGRWSQMHRPPRWPGALQPQPATSTLPVQPNPFPQPYVRPLASTFAEETALS